MSKPRCIWYIEQNSLCMLALEIKLMFLMYRIFFSWRLNSCAHFHTNVKEDINTSHHNFVRLLWRCVCVCVCVCVRARARAYIHVYMLTIHFHFHGNAWWKIRKIASNLNYFTCTHYVILNQKYLLWMKTPFWFYYPQRH
jgi:hypothetical protein